MPKGFVEVDGSVIAPRRLVIRVGGLDKDGKTHFALTAPGPIAFMNIDRGTEGVIEKFATEKTIYMTENFRDMPSTTDAENQKRWKAFHDCHWAALEDKKIRSIIWDTDTEAWEIARLAKFGRLEKVPPLMYTELNREFREMIDAAFNHDKNLILITKNKKQYVKRDADDKGSWNGKYEASGFTDLPYIVQANLRSRLEVGGAGVKPYIEFINCRQNMALKGSELEGDLATFPWVASYIIDGTSPED